MAEHTNKANRVPTAYYRPEQSLCPVCRSVLKRDHILWRKQITFSTGVKRVVNWVYHCPRPDCLGSRISYSSAQAEKLHLWHRRFSRELVIRIGYQRFWHHQTRDELHAWLTQDLRVVLSEREVSNLILDFLA